jgi:uncharacterized pyridoxamine 5'-phosphate oxidase family protein
MRKGLNNNSIQNYYHAAAAKSVYKQLENNPNVEICADPRINSEEQQ